MKLNEAERDAQVFALFKNAGLRFCATEERSTPAGTSLSGFNAKQ